MSTPRLSLSPVRRAWLGEMGVDLHWLVAGRLQPDAEAAQPVAHAAPATADSRPADFPATAPMVALQASQPRAAAAPAAPADPVPADLAPADCTDLRALARAMQARAARCMQAGRIVLGTGVADRPDYCLVGEQPGLEDESAGRPFQGDPGRLLRAMMTAVRLPQPKSAYLTLVVKQRAAGGRAPTAEEVLDCLPYLRQEIALVRPRCLLALGQVAAHAILGGDAGFAALRGGPHPCEVVPGLVVPVWVTHHPASLLVRSALKAEAWQDLLALARAMRDA